MKKMDKTLLRKMGDDALESFDLVKSWRHSPVICLNDLIVKILTAKEILSYERSSNDNPKLDDPFYLSMYASSHDALACYRLAKFPTGTKQVRSSMNEEKISYNHQLENALIAAHEKLYDRQSEIAKRAIAEQKARMKKIKVIGSQSEN